MLELKKLCLTANDENGKTEILKNNTHSSAEIRNLFSSHFSEFKAVNGNLTGIRLFLTHY